MPFVGEDSYGSKHLELDGGLGVQILMGIVVFEGTGDVLAHCKV